jgi:hypothetical protein
MLNNPIAANLLQVAIISGDNPYTVQQLVNEWLDKESTTAIQDIQMQQGNKTTTVMIVFRK